MKKLSFLCFIVFISWNSFSQKITQETSFFKLYSIGGELNLNYSYWDQDTFRDFFTDRQENSFYSGSIFLNTRSYFWHPNFLSLDVDAGYSPETGQRLSLVTPDRYEINTLKKLNIRALFLKNNPMNFSVFANFNEGFNNRENLTNFKSKYKNWGGKYSYTNKHLPFTLSYTHGEGDQTETETGRSYKTENDRFEAKAHRTFGTNDWNEISYTHEDYLYDTYFLINGLNLNNTVINNTIDSWSIYNNLYFDPKKNYNFNSRITNQDYSGDFNYKRLQLIENVFFKLPESFNFSGNYNLFDIKEDTQNTTQNDLRAALTHQLFKSLRTTVSYQYNNIINTQYEETIKRAGLDIRYVKKIPLDGLLTLSYRFENNLQDKRSDDSVLFVQNEEINIEDNQIVLLLNPGIDQSTVVVTDITGTIIYQINLDYILIERDEYLEIQRIPGGQISNNEIVFVDYIATVPRSYKFNAQTHYFMANVSLFQSKIEFYISVANQDFTNIINEDMLTLNYYDQNVYGSRFRFKFINGGIEYDNYRSAIIPYRLMKYYVSLHGNIKNNLAYAINGDVRDYQMIVEEGLKQKYYNISGNIFYNFDSKTRLNLEGSYIKEEGEGIDLDLVTARLELNTRYRQIYITTSFELYQNELFGEKRDFRKFNIQLSRKF